MKGKVLRSYKLSQDVIKMLEETAVASGLSMTEVLENCVRAYALNVAESAEEVRRTVLAGITKYGSGNKSRKR